MVLDQFGELSDYTDWSSTVTNNSQGEEKDIRAAYAQNGQAHKCEICSNRFPATVNCFDTYCIATLKRNRINAPCEFACVEACKLKLHMTKVHSASRRGQLYKCPFCAYASTDKSQLLSHLRSHPEAKPFKCDVCKKRFLLKRTLKVEINTLFNLMDNDH